MIRAKPRARSPANPYSTVSARCQPAPLAAAQLAEVAIDLRAE